MSSAAVVIGSLRVTVKVDGYTVKGSNSDISVSASIRIWVNSKRNVTDIHVHYFKFSKLSGKLSILLPFIAQFTILKAIQAVNSETC